MRQLSESGKRRLKEIEAKDKQIEEYEELLKKYLDIKPEDYRSLAEDAQNWRRNVTERFPKTELRRCCRNIRLNRSSRGSNER